MVAVTTAAAATTAPVTPTNLIPTYEIVTSCQPAVVYSNGFYYTSFVPPNNSTVSISTSTMSQPTMAVAACAACSCQQQQQVSQWSVPPPPIHKSS